jgi:hypothetical protein
VKEETGFRVRGRRVEEAVRNHSGLARLQTEDRR